MFESINVDLIDEPKKLVYEQGIFQKYGAHKFEKSGQQVFYNLWKKEFCGLDFRVISGDVSSIDRKEFTILGGHSDRIIVLRRTPTATGRDFKAVFDSQNLFRIFVGQSYFSITDLHDVDTVGGIIYVNKEGRKIDTKTFFAPVFSVDFRNEQPITWFPGYPSSINVYLCGDTLILASVHRDMNSPTLLGVILKEDELHLRFKFFTDIKYSILNGLKLGRWMCIRRNRCRENLKVV